MPYKAVIFDLFETLITEWGHKKYTKNELCADLNIDRDNFDTLDYKAKRELMKLMINKVESKGKDIIIHLFGSEEENIVNGTPYFPKGEYCK